VLRLLAVHVCSRVCILAIEAFAHCLSECLVKQGPGQDGLRADGRLVRLSEAIAQSFAY
jgi:hypothetical protein